MMLDRRPRGGAATEVVVDGDRASGSTVLLDLVPAVSALPADAEHRCTGLADVAVR
ncbi:hypothetical protein [Rathayibacter sp. VKM Ac-2801]|uniref:hypothetical protein n=1 Tax=Rathayibacter sp. VKM Ac-2801 TaxID=2609255 RepID=UPI00131F8784|nr:hypothetical protein [Rathayibacter sp. VKM Ac-2801]QHC70637.1 hypothetical protein GSU45_09850 [Rathayibacter sp. VKM Ac-2801]